MFFGGETSSVCTVVYIPSMLEKFSAKLSFFFFRSSHRIFICIFLLHPRIKSSLALKAFFFFSFLGLSPSLFLCCLMNALKTSEGKNLQESHDCGQSAFPSPLPPKVCIQLDCGRYVGVLASSSSSSSSSSPTFSRNPPYGRASLA